MQKNCAEKTLTAALYFAYKIQCPVLKVLIERRLLEQKWDKRKEEGQIV